MRQFGALELVVDTSVDAAYLYLKGAPRDREDRVGSVANTIVLEDLIPGYLGPDINLDFDKNGVLIGLEILG